MSNVLKEMYFGNILPIEGIDISDQSYKDAMNESVAKRTELEKSMDEYQINLLEQYTNACGKVNCELEAKAFASGFELATKIFTYVFAKE